VARSDSVRQTNLRAILRQLHLHGPASRSELVLRTGLTRSSVAAIVGELARAGTVIEEPAISDGSPGRPSPVVRADAGRNVVLALEVAVDFIAGALVGLGGVTHAADRIDRRRDRFSVESTVADLADLAARLLDPPVDLAGIGVAVAGLVKRPDNVVALAPNLGWCDVPLGALLGDALGLGIPIQLANEGDLAAVAETLRGAANGVDDVLLLSGEVGVGGGVVSGGRSLIGSAGFAGEIGHVTVNPGGRRCRCGSTGCWETEVGEGSLLRRAKRRSDSGRRGIDGVLAAAADGESVALAALRDEAHWLAVGLGGMLNVLNPQLVVFGGFFGRIHPFVIDDLRRELPRWGLAATTAGVDIVPSALGLDGPLIGAAELAFEPLLGHPA
jgi:predicted NBD/HSP70 family sugar kinase